MTHSFPNCPPGLLPFLDFQPEVAEALTTGKPVIALESSIIAQGMPWPLNVDIAEKMEALARSEGAVPATLAIIGGRLKIGINREEMELLGNKDKRQVPAAKVSRRDFADVLALKKDGGTTVAATLLMAHWAGIPVFATGGMGGVHRDAENTFDISADIRELASTPVVLVSAGAKAILDLPKTLELLETSGVPIIGYQTNEFPAFYSRKSGLSLDARAETPEEIARIYQMQRNLGFPAGIIVANPIPVAAEIPFDEMQQYISVALAEMRDRHVSGKAVTPFLLGKIVELTGNRSLQANVSLVENNVRLAARIARALKH